MGHSFRTLNHFLGSLELAGSRAYTHAPQQSNVKRAVYPTVEVSTGWWDAARSLERP